MSVTQTKWLYLTLLALVWGSSFILIKRGLVALTPIQLGSLRMVFAGSFLLTIGFKNITLIPAQKWKYIGLTAFFGSFVPAFLFSIAETEIDSTVTSILNSLTPIGTLILGFLFFGLRFKRNQVIGVVIGLIGSAILILSGAMHHPNQNYYYAILVIIAALCYATNVNLIKKYLSDLSPMTISVGNFALILIPALIILFSTNFSSQLQNVEMQQSVLFIAILGIVGTGIANLLFFKLIQISTPVFATSVTYLIPIVAFFWGLLDSEVLSPIQLFGAVIILGGVYLSSKK